MPAESAAELITAATPPPAVEPMTIERCDRCGNRAYVMTLHGECLPLSWCGHHYRAMSAALHADPHVVVAVDVRDTLISQA
jgi:hypothetical protein